LLYWSGVAWVIYVKCSSSNVKTRSPGLGKGECMLDKETGIFKPLCDSNKSSDAVRTCW